MQKYEKYKEAVKPLKRLILNDAATVFTRIEKEEEKIHKKYFQQKHRCKSWLHCQRKKKKKKK